MESEMIISSSSMDSEMLSTVIMSFLQFGLLWVLLLFIIGSFISQAIFTGISTLVFKLAAPQFKVFTFWEFFWKSALVMSISTIALLILSFFASLVLPPDYSSTILVVFNVVVQLIVLSLFFGGTWFRRESESSIFRGFVLYVLTVIAFFIIALLFALVFWLISMAF